MTLTLIRGLPGAGKTTLAQKLSAETGAIHLEADMFFALGGEYCFDASRLKEAHAWCLQQCADHLAAGHDVIVANTFVQPWEVKPYRNLARRLGAELKILTVTGNYPNIHGVGPEIIAKMRQKWQPIDGEVFVDGT